MAVTLKVPPSVITRIAREYSAQHPLVSPFSRLERFYLMTNKRILVNTIDPIRQVVEFEVDFDTEDEMMLFKLRWW